MKRVVPLAMILLVGAVVRLVLWLPFESIGIPGVRDDQREYNLLAKNLIQLGEFAYYEGVPTSIRPPLYPVFLAGVYKLFGLESYQVVRLIQAALSLVTVLLVYGLGAAVYSHRVGLWASGLYCFYPEMLGFNNLLMTEVLFNLLFCASCYTLIRSLQCGCLLWIGSAGVLLGLAALTRSIVGLLPPLLGVYLLFAWKGNLWRRLVAVLVLGLTFAATIAPWTIRNTLLEKTFVTIDTMGGRNFMMGNYEHTPLYRSWDSVLFVDDRNWFSVLTSHHPDAPRTTQGQRDKLALREGLKFVQENPGLTLHRDVIKFFQFWGLERVIVGNLAQGRFGDVSKVWILLLTVVVFGSYVATMISGVFGLVMVPPADKSIPWLFLLLIAFMCGLHTLVFAHSRYHLPLIPLILICSASAWVHAKDIWQRRRQWAFRSACVLSSIFILGWLWEISIVELDRFLNIFRSSA